MSDAEVRVSLEQLVPGVRVSGAIRETPVEVVAVRWHGTKFLTLTYRDEHGVTGDVALGRQHETRLRLHHREVDNQ